MFEPKERKTSYSSVFLPILAGILIYLILGSVFTIWGTDIYDDFPEKNFVIDKDKTFKFIVKNNAPFELPYVKLPHVVAIEISNETGHVTCEVLTAKGYVSCEDKPFDLGYIPTGGMKNVCFKLMPNKNNFTITCKNFVSIFGSPIETDSKRAEIVFVNTTIFGDEYIAITPGPIIVPRPFSQALASAQGSQIFYFRPIDMKNMRTIRTLKIG